MSYDRPRRLQMFTLYNVLLSTENGAARARYFDLCFDVAAGGVSVK